MQQNNKNRWLNYIPYLIVLIAVFSLFQLNSGGAARSLSYSELQDVLKNQTVSDAVVSIGSNVISVKGTYEDNGRNVVFTATAPATSEEITTVIADLKDAKISVVDSEASNGFLEAMYSFVPMIIIVVMGIWMMNRMNGAGGANAKAFEFGKSRAQSADQDQGAFQRCGRLR
jgi:cell division protease FtsH